MRREMFISALLCFTLTLIQRSNGHGYMLEPPSRSSMWRVGFKTPINRKDDNVSCAKSKTDCRVCGNRDNEPGGKYATGIISRRYREGQTITANVVITINHTGWFEFHLCPNNDVSRPASEQCLKSHILRLKSGGTRYNLRKRQKGKIAVELVLPTGVTCSQCVLRWYWEADNNERYFGCADVSIAR